MAELGDMLRDAREARGISLAEAERDTKIRARYLAALEDDKPSLLPGSVYARGFIRNYAHYLGLDPEEALDLYDKESLPTRAKIREARGDSLVGQKRGKSDVDTISIHPLSPQPVDTRVRYGSSYITVSMLAVPLIILFYFIYSFWGFSRSVNLSIPTPGPPTLTPLTLPTLPASAGAGTGAFNTPTVAVALPPALVPAYTATSAANPTTKPANQVTVKIVTTRDAWMRVLVDGVQQFNGTLPKDSTRTWTGKSKVRIRTGRADSVQLTVNGTDKGLMRTGSTNVVEKEWDRSGNEKLIK